MDRAFFLSPVTVDLLNRAAHKGNCDPTICSGMKSNIYAALQNNSVVTLQHFYPGVQQKQESHVCFIALFLREAAMQ